MERPGSLSKILAFDNRMKRIKRLAERPVSAVSFRWSWEWLTASLLPAGSPHKRRWKKPRCIACRYPGAPLLNSNGVSADKMQLQCEECYQFAAKPVKGRTSSGWNPRTMSLLGMPCATRSSPIRSSVLFCCNHTFPFLRRIWNSM